MNDIMTHLHERKSVREYTGDPVSATLKKSILEAAVQAPTAGGQQLYTILDVTDQALKDRLSETCDGQSFIARAPVVLIFCADCRKWLDAYVEANCQPRTPGAGDLFLAFSDALIAAQNAVVAADSLGLGSCYIGDILERYEDHRVLLNLPAWVVPAAMLTIGWPTPQQMERKKTERFHLKYLVHENTYRHMDGDELRKMFAERAGAQGFGPWVTAFHRRKYGSDFAREMSRSVREYLRDFEDEDEDGDEDFL